jgi:hypothetical protein
LGVAPINWAALCIVNEDHLDTSAAGGDSKQATVSIPKPKKKSAKERRQARVDGRHWMFAS